MKIIDRISKFPIFFVICSFFCVGASVANGAQDQNAQQGIAKWISKSFQGKPTASGEPHDYNDLVAAHQTFPFGTYVQVVNLDNGKTAIVRINDRIPRTSDSLITVSWRAAKMLDMLDSGVAKVEIKQVQTETGIASWYGNEFHNKKTANGEIYDMNQMTAAHQYLPFNTRVRVVNLGNNKSIVVRINDRGPYAKQRIIDLSRKAAIELGMLIKGTAKVRLEILPPLLSKPVD